MKKIVLILFLLSSHLFANNIEWMEYDEALHLAKKQDKIVMLMLGRSTCNVCGYMSTVVFKDKNVIEEFKKKFLAVYIELDFEEAPDNFEFFGTPTFYFLDKDKKVLERIDGGKRTPSFIETLEKLN